MAIVPKPIAERVQFFESRVATMMANAIAIGSSPEQIALLAANVAAARAAYQAQYDAEGRARTATAVLKSAMDALSRQGATVIAQVRSQAQLTGDPAVYTLALLPQPAAKSAVPEPGTPTGLECSLDAVGNVTLTWECKNPRGSEGTMYEIHRCTTPGEPFEYLGVVGKKRFVDKTIPTGATAIGYRVTAIRSTKRGQTAEFSVKFGSNGATPLPEFYPSKAA